MKVRPDEFWGIVPRTPQSEIIIELKNLAGAEATTQCTEHWAWRAADYIIELENKIKELENERRIRSK